MKTLPLQKLPADRMAAMTQQGARELRAERIAQVQAQWHDDTDDDSRCGLMLAVLLILCLLAYGGGWLAIYLLIR
jgi:hypothetical protein